MHTKPHTGSLFVVQYKCQVGRNLAKVLALIVGWGEKEPIPGHIVEVLFVSW